MNRQVALSLKNMKTLCPKFRPYLQNYMKNQPGYTCMEAKVTLSTHQRKPHKEITVLWDCMLNCTGCSAQCVPSSVTSQSQLHQLGQCFLKFSIGRHSFKELFPICHSISQNQNLIQKKDIYNKENQISYNKMYVKHTIQS